MIINKIVELLGGQAHQGEATQQIKCIFKKSHKSGDVHKSARIYKDSDKYFCFGCMKFPLSPVELYAKHKEVSLAQATLDLRALGFDIKEKDARLAKESEERKLEGLRVLSSMLRTDFPLAIQEIRKFKLKEAA